MIKLGFATVLVIAVVLLGALGLGKLGLGKTEYQAEFGQAAGLSVGDQVTVAGIRVGTVTSMRLAGDRVLVGLDVDDNVHMGSATRAAVKLTTLLGARYVEVLPAGSGTLQNDRIPLEQTEVPYDLQTALQDATATFEAVDARKLAQSMTTLSQQLQGSPEILPQALDNVQHLSSVIANRRDQIGAMLRSTERVTEVLGNQRKGLGMLITQGNEVLGELASRRDVLVRLINATTTLVNTLRPILVDNRSQIDALLANLENMQGSIVRNDALLRSTLQVMPVPLRNFANATGNGNEFDFTSSGGTMIDSFMCAISSRAPQFNLPPYFQDCAPQ